MAIAHAIAMPKKKRRRRGAWFSIAKLIVIYSLLALRPIYPIADIEAAFRSI
jgi:hypothetical protein